MRFFLVLAAFLALGVSCSPSHPDAPPPVDRGVVSYIDGEAFLKNADGWTALQAGDQIPQGATVKTGPASKCEIQFGQTGAVHLSANTVMTVTTAELTALRKRVELDLSLGSLTSKVARLTGDDRYQIKTSEAMAGVRGTKFTVTESLDGLTKIAVEEGVVAALPPSFDPIALEAAATSPNALRLTAAVVEQLSAASKPVGADSQIIIGTEAMADADAAATRVLDALKAALGTASGAGAELPAAVDQAVGAYRDRVNLEKRLNLQPLDPQSKAVFEETAGLQLAEILPMRNQESGTASDLSAPEAIAPVNGETIDLLSATAMTLKWKPVTGADAYRVDLFSVSGGTKTVINTWTTKDLSVEVTGFGGLAEGEYSWDVRALKQSGSEAAGAVTASNFTLIKSGTLKAPTINTLPSPKIKLGGSP